MGGFTLGQVAMIVVIAYVGVWAIDKGLAAAGMSSWAVNS